MAEEEEDGEEEDDHDAHSATGTEQRCCRVVLMSGREPLYWFEKCTPYLTTVYMQRCPLSQIYIDIHML